MSFGLEEGHAETCADVGREAVPGGDVPIGIRKQRLEADLGVERMVAVAFGFGNASVSAVFEFGVHGHAEHGIEIVTHGKSAAGAGAGFGIGAEALTVIRKFALGMLNVQHEFRRNVHADKIGGFGLNGQQQAGGHKQHSEIS